MNNELPRGFLQRKTVIWLGTDDDFPPDEGMNGYGFRVSREDNTVLIEALSSDGNEKLEVFIHRDLWPKIRMIMDHVNERYEGGSR